MHSRRCVSTMIFFILLLLVAGPLAHAATLRASGGSADLVIAAINNAEDGDTVIIPAGDFTWSTPVTADCSARALIISGEGIDQTTIRVDTGGMVYALDITDSAPDKGVEITKLTMIAHDADDTKMLRVGGSSQQFRIHHAKFIGDGTKNAYAINMKIDQYFTYGVIDHCEFIDCHVNFSSNNDSAWQRALSLGTTNAWYVEDCIFSNPNIGWHNVIDDDSGARYVARHNTLTDASMLAHSNCSSGNRAGFSVEIYENEFKVSGSHGYGYTPIAIRGGTGVVYNNTFEATWNQPHILLDNRRACMGINGTCTGWNPCNGIDPLDGNAVHSQGATTGALSTITLTDVQADWLANSLVGSHAFNITDGSHGEISANTATSITVSDLSGGNNNQWEPGDQYEIRTGYPCIDQIGRATDTGKGTVQDHEPMYEWNNRYDPQAVDGDANFMLNPGMCDRTALIIMEGRDYFNNTTRPGYTALPYPHPLASDTTTGDSVTGTSGSSGGCFLQGLVSAE